MGLAYTALGKWAEAQALLERAGEQLQQARKQLTALPASKPREVELQRLAPLDARINGEKCVLTARAVLQSLPPPGAAPAAGPVSALLCSHCPSLTCPFFSFLELESECTAALKSVRHRCH